MDAQRSRRTRDEARKTWYAYYRQVRFARWFGFLDPGLQPDQICRNAAFLNGISVRPLTANVGLDQADWSETAGYPTPCMELPS